MPEPDYFLRYRICTATRGILYVEKIPRTGPSIQLGADTVPACDHVPLLGAIN